MESKARIFFAQPVDHIERNLIVDRVQKVRKLVRDLPVEIIAPYCDENWFSLPLSHEEAIGVIEKDISSLDSCDILLVDLSRYDRLAIGIVFEMAYFWYVSKKKIIVYTENSSVADRIWISATTQNICRSWDDLKSIVQKCIQS
jgi:nucleoside 2-deoxyribosyltransferase